jgi:imidazolonepropionase-like amidohydrolase
MRVDWVEVFPSFPGAYPMHLLVRLTGAAALGACLVTPASGQHPPVAPATWAITGARIEPVSGPAIAKGTVVIREGLIVSVGANVPVPGDARVIEGAGLTVYPGFIDGYGTLGMPAPTPATGGGPAAQAAARRPAAPNSSYAAGLQPEVNAVAELEPTATAFTAARGAGFTAALTAPGTGVFRGRSTLILLGDGRPAQLVVREDVAQHIGFSRGGGFGGGGGYPGSLMGVFAQLRQQLLDAQTWRDNQAAYARNPRGMTRPAHDPSLEALQPVIAGQQPVIMLANTEREITRALDLAREFGLMPIIAGGREAWKVTDRLRAANAAVLLDIDFPRRTAPSGGRSAVTADDPPEAMRVLRQRVEAPKGPGLLAGAGVRFAMVSNGEFTEFAANLRRAVAAGLARDRALRAITLEPATLLGVADRLGSIETGKIANLTIVSGDLFADGGRVTQVFIDGAHHEVPAPSTPGSGRGQ